MIWLATIITFVGVFVLTVGVAIMCYDLFDWPTWDE